MVVLVGYATEHGSTHGVAERIAQRLQQGGVAVEVRSISDVPDLSRYNAAVLGSAVHSGKWLPDAARFVDRNTVGLRKRPVWLFSVSTLGDQESMFPPRVAKWLRTLRKETQQMTSLRAAIAPREHRNFAGAIARCHWPASGRAVFRVMGGRYGDHRNWAAIEAWADRIAAQLRPTAVAHDLTRQDG